MALSKRERYLLVLAFFVIIIISLLKWVVLPGWYEYQHLETEIAKNEHLMEKNRLILNSGDKYRRSLAETLNELTEVESLFFHEEINQVQVKVLNCLDDYLEVSGLMIKSKDMVLERPPDKELTRTYYRLNLEGGLKELVSFLDLLSKDKKLFKVDRLDIRGGDNATSLAIDISIKVINREGEFDVD